MFYAVSAVSFARKCVGLVWSDLANSNLYVSRSYWLTIPYAWILDGFHYYPDCNPSGYTADNINEGIHSRENHGENARIHKLTMHRTLLSCVPFCYGRRFTVRFIWHNIDWTYDQKCRNYRTDIILRMTTKRKIFAKTHNGITSIHRGENRTYYEISRRVYWPNIAKHVHDYICTCNACRRNKFDGQLPQG